MFVFWIKVFGGVNSEEVVETQIINDNLSLKKSLDQWVTPKCVTRDACVDSS